MAEHNVVFTTLDHETPWSLETYLQVDGYKAWKKILAEKTPQEDIIDAVDGHYKEHLDIEKLDALLDGLE